MAATVSGSWNLSFFFFLTIPFASALRFNLPSIGTGDGKSIKLIGDAYISNQGIQVTPDERNTDLGKKVGQATYKEPLHLWNKASGDLTDFATHWVVRYRIAQGLASALLYLHEEWEQCVVHRDIKSSNVMLDSNFNAKLRDFGLARMIDHGKGSQTTVLAGTMGYMDPEYIITGKYSRESDVYSFGIVALEVACGRKPIDPNAPENQIRMVEWVWNLYGMDKVLEAADSKLTAEFDEQEIEHLMIVGLWCAHPDPNLRPLIKQVIHVLNFEAPLPVLPSKMPVPTYLSLSRYTPTSSQPLSYGTTVSEISRNQSSSYS